MREVRNPYRILIGKPKGKKPVGRHTYSWKYNIKMDTREIKCEDAN
jgi:hypothetical protein